MSYGSVMDTVFVSGLTVNLSREPVRVFVPDDVPPEVPPVEPVVEVPLVPPVVLEAVAVATFAIMRAVKVNSTMFGLLNLISLFPLSSPARKSAPTSCE